MDEALAVSVRLKPEDGAFEPIWVELNAERSSERFPLNFYFSHPDLVTNESFERAQETDCSGEAFRATADGQESSSVCC